jgi:hypothetical protein
MNYWFLYKLDTGEIYGAPYLGTADQWTNIPDGCGVLGPFPQDSAPQEVVDAFNNPQYYVVQDGELVKRPNFTLFITPTSTQNQYTITAILDNPPDTPPTSCTITVAGTEYTATLTNNEATMTVNVHPSVVDQAIPVMVSSTGCVSGNATFGGTRADIRLQSFTPQGSTIPTIAPAGVGSKPFLANYWNSTVPQSYTEADVATALGLLMQTVYGIILPSLTSGTNPLIALDDNQKNAVKDIVNNILPYIPTTIENAAPVPTNGQPQTYDVHYQSYMQDMQASKTAFQNYMNDIQTIPNLSY